MRKGGSTKAFIVQLDYKEILKTSRDMWLWKDTDGRCFDLQIYMLWKNNLGQQTRYVELELLV